MQYHRIFLMFLLGFALFCTLAQAQDVLFIPAGEVEGVKVGSFYLSQEAITNQDFFTFIQLDGYKKTGLWDPDGLKNLPRFKNAQGDYGPRGWKENAPPQNQEFQPIVGISIYEAQAYAKNVGWLIPTLRMWKRAQEVLKEQKKEIGEYPWREEEADNVAPIRMARHAAPAHVWETRFESLQKTLSDETKARVGQFNLIQAQERRLKTFEQKAKDLEQIPETLEEKLASLEKKILDRVSQQYDAKIQAAETREKARDAQLASLPLVQQKLDSLTQDMVRLRDDAKATKDEMSQQIALLSKENTRLLGESQNSQKKLEQQEKDLVQVLQTLKQMETKRQDLEGKIQDLQNLQPEQSKKNKIFAQTLDSLQEKLKEQEKLDIRMEAEVKNLKLAEVEHTKKMVTVQSILESAKQRSDEMLETIKSRDQKFQESLAKLRQETEAANKQIVKNWDEDVKSLRMKDEEQGKESVLLSSSLKNIRLQGEELQGQIKSLEKKSEAALLSLKKDTDEAYVRLSKKTEDDAAKLSLSQTTTQAALASLQQEGTNRHMQMDNALSALKTRMQTVEAKQTETIRQISLSASEMRKGMSEVGEKIHRLFQNEMLFGPLPTPETTPTPVKPPEEVKKPAPQEIPIAQIIAQIVPEIKAKVLADVLPEIIKRGGEYSQATVKKSLGEFCFTLGEKYEAAGQAQLSLAFLDMAKGYEGEAEKTQAFLKTKWAMLQRPTEMIYIPAGLAKLGSTKDPEFPPSEKNMDAFYIDRYETTRKQFAQFVLSGGYKDDSHWSEEGKTWRAGRTAPLGWKAPTPEEENLPIVNVTYYEAEAYSKWAGKRLPTVEEWEYAARGKDARIFPWGNTTPQVGKVFFTNYRQMTEPKDGVERVAPVDAFFRDRSPLGLMGMAGNVSEWCVGTYQIAGSKRKLNAVKGGSFAHLWFRLQLFTVLGRDRTEALDYVGFRCVKDIPVQK